MTKLQRLCNICANSFKWLRTSLILLGLLWIGEHSYLCLYGLPTWLQTAEINKLQADFKQTQDSVVLLLNWKQDQLDLQKAKVEQKEVGMKLAQQDRIKIAKR